MQIAEVMISSV